MKKSSAFLLAASAMALSTVAYIAPAVAAPNDMGHCMGMNSCKGTSDCKSATHACKGQNACKGQGFRSMTESECKASHGKFEAMGR